MTPPLRYCPSEFGGDMTDPRNLAYCQEIQRQDGEACRKKRCQYYVHVEREEAKPCTRSSEVIQGRLF